MADLEYEIVGFPIWRKMGDAISTFFALGLHEEIKPGPNTPLFLCQLRKMAFGRVYSADKELSAFLGRPPRLSKKFCTFQLPLDIDMSYLELSEEETIRQNKLDSHGWNIDGKIHHVSDTRFATLAGAIREDILGLLLGTGDQNIEQSIS